MRRDELEDELRSNEPPERCHNCDRPEATEADYERYGEGEGEHLCWGGCTFMAVDWRTRAHAAEEESKGLREGLRYLGYAMQDGDCQRIRDRWGGNTPEDWCGEADALHGILEELRENEGVIKVWRRRTVTAERRAAVLAALLGCAHDVELSTVSISFAMQCMSTGRFTQLMESLPETKPIIETALGAAGLTIEDLDVLEETT